VTIIIYEEKERGEKMRIECEECKYIYCYNAQKYDYEESECPECGHFNPVLDFDE